MTMSGIVRQNEADQVWTIADNAQVTDAMKFAGMAGGGFVLPTGFVSTSIGFSVGLTEAGTFYALEDSAGDAIAMTVQAERAYSFPAELFGWPWVKMTTGSQETGGPLTIPVVLQG